MNATTLGSAQPANRSRIYFLCLSFVCSVTLLLFFLCTTVPGHRTAQSKFTAIESSHNAAPSISSRPGEYAFNLVFMREFSFANTNRMEFLLARDGIERNITEAAIDISGYDCALKVQPFKTSSARPRLIFLLDRNCRQPGISAGTRMTIRISDSAPGYVHLSAQVVRLGNAPADALLRLADDSDRGLFDRQASHIIPILRLDERAGPDLTRAQLLAFMWGEPFTGTGIACGAVLLLVLCFVGAVLLLVARGPMGASIACLCICCALFGGWSLLTPPLQAPDEADHFLAFFANQPATAANRPDILAWANRMHFERIKFRPEEGFNGAHVNEPLAQAWSAHVVPENIKTRSTLTYQAWQSLSANLAGFDLSAGLWLYVLRLLNSAAVAVAFCIACLAITGTGQGARAKNSCIAFLLPLLLLPTLAFFSMHVSNYGFSIAGYVIFCAGLFLLIQSGQRSLEREALCGTLLGFGMAVCVLSSRSGPVMFSFLLFVLLARSLFEKVQFRNTASFWLAIGCAFLLCTQLAEADFRAHVSSTIGLALARFHVFDQPPAFFQVQVFFGFAILIAACVERAIQRVIAMPKAGDSTLAGFNAVFFFAGSIFLAVLIAANTSAGPLANNELTQPLRGFAYVWPVVTGFLEQLFPFSTPDFYLTTSFWGGFGWLDRLLPDAIIFLLKLVPLCAYLLCGFHAVGDPTARSAFLRLSLFLVGAIFLVAAIAYAMSAVPVNLHGRYLILPYFVLLLSLMRLTQFALPALPNLSALLVGSLPLIHTGLWCWLLQRYFF